MGSLVKEKSIKSGRGAGARHEDDLYTWAMEQAALLRAGRVTEIDAKNISEELADVGNEQYDKLESALRIVLLHLLKWDHQPEKRSRSWALSVREHRRRIMKILRRNPGLKPHIAEAIHDGYLDARDEAMIETGFDEAAFPLDCPYSWDEILNRLLDTSIIASRERG